MTFKTQRIALLGLLMVAAILASTAEVAVAQSPKQVALKFSTAMSPASWTSQGLRWWADEVTKKTAGRIQFNWYYGGALSKPGEEQEHCRTGLVDMVASSATWHAHMALWEMNGALPFQPSDTLLAVKTKWTLYWEFPELRREIEQKKQRLVMITPYGDYHIISRLPLQKLDDLKGLKVAVLGRQQQKWMQHVGSIPSFIPGPARYEALGKGVVDASLMGGLGTSWAFRHHEVCKHMLLADLGQYCSFFATINEDKWRKISAEDQRLMEDLAKTTMFEWFPKKLEDETLGIRTKMEKDHGITFRILSDEDRAKWALTLPNLAKEWVDEATDGAGKDLRKKIYGRYMEITKAGGYKWPMDWSKVD